MNWFFDNFDILIPIIVAVLYFLSRMRPGSAETMGEDVEAPPRVDEVEIEEAERTRRVQEEIRRKIAERQRGRPAPVEAGRETSGSVFERSESGKSMPRSFMEPAEEPPVVSAPSAMREIFERQELVREQLRKAEDARRRSREQVKKAGKGLGLGRTIEESEVGSPVSPFDLPVPIEAYNVRRQLKDNRSLREAILLREILGPPKGLDRSFD